MTKTATQVREIPPTSVPEPIRTFAQAEQVLASTLPGYESRPQQQALAAFVEQTLANKGHGLAEAGCGVGKSLGSMIPAILSGKRTVVVTATLALMSQYATTDIPFLAEHLGVPFTWSLLKGRSNYFCEAKAANPTDRVSPDQVAMMRAELEANPEHTGDRDDFTTPVTKEEFSQLSSTSVECPGKRECPFGEICFAERAKKKAAASQIIITNAAMLMTDLKVREATDGLASMLGEYDALIIDEAHELEEIATSQLEETFRPASVAKLVKEVENFTAMQSGVAKAGPRVLDAMNAVADTLPVAKVGDKTRLGLSFFLDHADAYIAMTDALRALMDDVMETTIERDEKKANARRGILVSRISNQIRRYQMLVTAEEADLVRWVEAEKDSRSNLVKVLHFAPINVGPFLGEWLWSQVPAVLVSATLSVGGNFDFIKARLGLTEATTLNAGTPFDYSTQAMLFVPDPKMPSPKNSGAWMTYSNTATMELIDAAGGGALLLFTSRTAMAAAYEDLAPRLADRGFTTLCQGVTGTNKEIAKTFKSDVHSVLFALKSFFTGVDIPGEACRLVCINKLPFAVPTDPVFQARCDQIKRRGGSDFNELSIPAMTLTLTQGFGRLIRTATDKGVVAILDSRLSSTGYGRRIVGALPDCPATTNLGAVREFYARTA
jgi:ATP-dependent DNA helicase DinG